jgi:hypothetical protein
VDRPPAIDPDVVQEMVRKAHGDLDRVKQLLAEQPRLANAVWDWGGGDFESALGAAAHVGRRDIAMALLDNGARLDLFAAAMLGKLEIVKAVLQAFPAALTVPGPHGIPLVTHAKAGGTEAQVVYDYLVRLGCAA